MSEHVETCLNLFRFNMIWIVTIHAILKRVWTCLNMFRFNMIRIVTIHGILKHVWTCSDSIWYELLQFMWFSNMSEHVETCLNLFRFNMIWIVTIHMILKHALTEPSWKVLVRGNWLSPPSFDSLSTFQVFPFHNSFMSPTKIIDIPAAQINIGPNLSRKPPYKAPGNRGNCSSKYLS